MLVSIGIMLLTGLFFGRICNKLRLPSLVGMIVAGVWIGPHMLSILDSIIIELSPQLRQVALVIVLTRAGLALNIYDLWKVGKPALLLCFLPATVEIMGIVLLAPRIMGITTIEAVLMGCVLAAVSPAVIVPRMLKMMEEGYGVEKSIPQMILAGVSVDDVYVIVLFTSVMAIASGGNLSSNMLLEIPISIVLGVLIGIITGVIYIKVINWCSFSNAMEVILLLSSSFLLLGLEEKIGEYIPISALLAIMSVGITIYHKRKTVAISLSNAYEKLWVAAEIILFVLVGASVNIEYLRKEVGFAMIIVGGGLIFRMLGVWISTIGARLEWKERIFCSIAYTPKATVQAAIGGIPLAMGLPCGEIILTTAVVAILLTAPIGAVGIDTLAHRLTNMQAGENRLDEF